MDGVLLGFVTVGVIVGLGVLLAHLGFLDEAAQRLLARLSFFVATPALLVSMIGHSDLAAVLSRNLIASSVSALVCAGGYALAARLVWSRGLGHTVIGMLCAAYVNSGYLGIPVAAYVLGNAALVVPTLLLQVLILQPVALAVLDADANGIRPSPWRLVRSAVTNPIPLASMVGLALALTGWQLPRLISEPLSVVAAMAVPTMLIAYGCSLRLGPGLGGDGPRGELALTVALKSVAQPVVAWAVGLALGLTGTALLAVVVVAALPTAQNVFVHATRYRRGEVLARDSILLSTVLSVPVIAAAAWALT